MELDRSCYLNKSRFNLKQNSKQNVIDININPNHYQPATEEKDQDDVGYLVHFKSYYCLKFNFS